MHASQTHELTSHYGREGSTRAQGLCHRIRHVNHQSQRRNKQSYATTNIRARKVLASQTHELKSHTGREGSTRAPRPLPPNTTHQIIERHENINQSCATMSRARNMLASQTHELTSHTGREGNTRPPRPLPPNTTRQFIKRHTPSCANIACFVNIHVNHPAPRIHTIVS